MRFSPGPLIKNKMKISIDLEDIQFGKQYTLIFSIAEDGNVLVDNTIKNKKQTTSANKTSPNIEDFETKEQDISTTKEHVVKKEFKVESSFGGKITPN